MQFFYIKIEKKLKNCIHFKLKTNSLIRKISNIDSYKKINYKSVLLMVTKKKI